MNRASESERERERELTMKRVDSSGDSLHDGLLHLPPPHTLDAQVLEASAGRHRHLFKYKLATSTNTPHTFPKPHATSLNLLMAKSVWFWNNKLNRLCGLSEYQRVNRGTKRFGFVTDGLKHPIPFNMAVLTVFEVETTPYTAVPMLHHTTFFGNT